MQRKPHSVLVPIFIIVVVAQLHGTCEQAFLDPGLPTTGAGSTDNVPAGSDTFEPDDLIQRATVIVPDQPQSHSIYPPGDADYMTFTLAQASPVTIEVSTNNRLTIRLLDANRGFLDYDNGQNSNGAPRIVRAGAEELPAGTYFIQVNELSDRGVATYELSISFAAPDDSGEHSIAGTVLGLNGNPMAGVTLTSGSRATVTDPAGNYVLSGLGDFPFNISPSLAGFEFSPPSMTATVAGGNVTDIDFVGFDASNFSLLQATTAGDGVAAFNVNGTTARVKAVDVRTGNPLAGITALLLTDGTDGIYGLVDPAGVFLPRFAGGFSAPGGPVSRTVDQTASLSLVGSLTLSTLQADAVTFDEIPASVWPFMRVVFATLRAGSTRSALDGNVLSVGTPQGSTSVQFVVERVPDGAVGLVPALCNRRIFREFDRA